MHKDIIQEIRNDFSPENNSKRTLNTLAPAIKTLAADLYAKETHFIFELIQNAEDNTYETEAPFLRFVLTKTRFTADGNDSIVLIVENNEIGFQKENVESICSVGNSTKTEDQGRSNKTKDKGYIGEKGIGFKSVFRVTSCPYIFSNGFHFSLPENDTFSGLGYIVPTWIESIPADLNEKITSIYLPLDQPDFSVNKVTDALRDIAPETIIFLKKLKTIELVVTIGKQYEIIIEKDVSEFPLVKLIYLKKDNQKEIITEQLFWVTSKEFAKPTDINHAKRVDVSFREVSIAIPLRKKTQGQLFAYLPVWENTGLPFLVNADFLLTSSRESVKEGIPWNDWLRSCIAEVYVDGLTSCLSSKDLAFDKKITSYASLPQSTNHSFLKPVISAIQERLKEIACVYTANCDVLAIPKSTRIAPKVFWDLLKEGDFPDVLRKRIQLVCPELRPYNQDLRALGASPLDREDIMECLDDESWLTSKSHEWFLKLYRYLKKNKIEDDTLMTKKIVKVWSDTIQTSILSCNEHQPIYFERDDESRTTIKDVPEWLQKIVPIAFLDRNFLEDLVDQEDGEELREWMKTHLNIHHFSKTNYCFDILNVLREHYESLSPKKIAVATSFLTAHTDDDFDDWDMLPVVLNNGEKRILSEFYRENIIVPECYNRTAGWQHIWVTENDRKHFVVLANCYKTSTINYLITHSGVIIKKFPPPYHYQDDGYYNEYDDHKAPEWMKRAVALDSTKRDALLEWSKNNTVPDYRFVHRSRPDGRYNFSLEANVDAEFKKCFLKFAWLPSQKGFVRPDQAFLPKKEIIEILGDTVHYLQDDLSEESIELLGITTELTVGELLETLTKHSGETNVNQEMVHRIYSALNTRTQFSSFQNIIYPFKTQKLIFVPNSEKEGQWYALENVIWEDAEKILGGDFTYLEKSYPKLKDFFLDTLEVKERADPESFAQRWLRIQNDTGKSLRALKELMDPIYRILLPIVKKEPDERPEWWNDFVEEALILTQNGSFIGPEEVVVPDDGELKKIFRDTAVEFVWRPEKDSFNQWAPFYEAFGIPRISESVESELAGNTDFEIMQPNKFVTQSMILMLSAWLREKDNKYYNKLFEDGIFEKLYEIREAATGEEIEIQFTMETGQLFEEVQEDYPVFWNHNENVLLINRSANQSDIKRKVSAEIAKGLMKNRAYKDLAHWVECILGEEDTERLQDEGWPVPREISKLFRKNTGSAKNTPSGKEAEKTKKDNMFSEKVGIPPVKANETLDTEEPRDNFFGEKVSTPEDLEKTEEKEPTRINENKGNSSGAPFAIAQEERLEPPGKDFEGNDLTEDTNTLENIIEKFEMAFNKDGETSLSEEFEDDDFYNKGTVKNPDWRRKKSRTGHKDRITGEPTQDKRRRETIRKMLESPDPATKDYLLKMYSGECQICEKTFPQRNGRPYFVVGHIVERKHARLLDNPANALCLCPLHFAQWRHGAVEADNIVEQVLTKKTKVEGGVNNLSLQIGLCGKRCEITYKEKHIVDLQSLLAELINLDE